MKPHEFFFRRRQVLLPTLPAILLGMAIAATLGSIAFRNAHRFLAVTAPLTCSRLVIEGWVPDSAFDAAIEEYKRGGYSTLYVTGLPLERGAPLSQYKNYAALGAAILEAKGFNPLALVPAPAPSSATDRTYTSAVALRERLAQNKDPGNCVNVMTLGAHARRTKTVFQLALEPAFRAGIISIPDRAYDPDRWWASSAGFRTVTDELIAYIYATLLFHEQQGDVATSSTPTH